MAEPITLDQAKAHLRVTSGDEDEDIGSAIIEARAAIEDATGLVMAPRSVVESFDRFGAALQLRAWPVTAITSIQYLDVSGSVTTLDASGYRLAAVKKPARIAPIGLWPRLIGWPFRGSQSGAVTVTVAAGYASPSDIPPAVIRALKLMIGHFYEHREAAQAGDRAAAVELPLGVEMLLRRYKIRTL